MATMYIYVYKLNAAILNRSIENTEILANFFSAMITYHRHR